mmetsp:Transcript_52120/g.124142  ORF Transcript_52120/g.124142 Transcript_52120/m.124142 type:complete len:606 (-) Transcript_52120:264-2081(-)
MSVEVDLNAAARDTVELNGDEVAALGEHLEEIGGLIATAELLPKKGKMSVVQKISDNLHVYKEYANEINRRRAELEARLKAEFERMQEWRQFAGSEGESLLDQLNGLLDKAKELQASLKLERTRVACERGKVQELLEVSDRKDKKIEAVCQRLLETAAEKRRMESMFQLYTSMMKNSFSEVRFKFKAQQEKERLMVEHHQKMRKSRAQARLDVISRERDKRLLQRCFLGMQEEVVEARHSHQMTELRQRHKDENLVLNGQLAQAVGDEEAAKELVYEQVRRMEEARSAQEEAEKQSQKALWVSRQAEAEAEAQSKRANEARSAQSLAEEQRDASSLDAAQSKAEAAQMRAERDDAVARRMKAEKLQLEAEEEVRRKLIKIDRLQRMLAELGAESDSDGPFEERPPPFFVNADRTKVPRPRTRKERMAMAYREAEAARWESKLVLAAVIDEGVANAQLISRLRSALRLSEQEVEELRWANRVLVADVNATSSSPAAAASGGVMDDIGMSAPIPAPPEVPLAPTLVGVAQSSPTRPHFVPAQGEEASGSPRLLLKSPSAPVLMPPLCTNPAVSRGAGSEKVTLGPLRQTKKRLPGLLRTSEWSPGWH